MNNVYVKYHLSECVQKECIDFLTCLTKIQENDLVTDYTEQEANDDDDDDDPSFK